MTIPTAPPGTTDACRLSPFCDNTPMTGDTVDEQIRAHQPGAASAADTFGGP
jgi:hypothetical protein